MKAIHILYDCIIEKKIHNFLKINEIERFAQVDNLKCEWRKDLKHMNNNAWPGTDSMILVFIEDDKAEKLIAEFKNFKENIEENVPLFLAAVNVDVII